MLGPVFRAYQPDPGRLVAVKQFRLDLPPETAHRFVAALDRLIAADLTHLGIAAPLAAGLADASPFLALDFVAAESFDVVIRDYGSSTPIAEALRIATQLGGALDFAASVNVFHGALHPRDVLVSADDTKVTGLGIAQALEGLGIAPPIRRPYAAPERVAGAAWDRRADSFSLAALVFEMLCGRRIAGVGHEAAEAIQAIEGVDLDSLRALFGRALAENPADRFDTALAFADALQGAFSQSVRPARTPRGRRKRDAEVPAERRSPVRASGPSLPLDTPSDLSLAREAAAGPLPEPDQRHAHPADAPHEFADLVLEPTVRPRDDQDSDNTATATSFAEPFAEPFAPAVAPSLEPREVAPDVAARSSSVTFEQTRSAIWPIALALLVGLLVGFAFGYGTGTRTRTTVVSRTDDTESTGNAPSAASSQAETGGAAVSAPTPAAAASVPAQPRVTPAPPPAALQSTRPGSGATTTAAQTAAQNGRLLVRSTPAGARVNVNGRDAGVTPLTVASLPPGAYVVRITHQGYVAAERRVRIRAAQPAQPIEVDLVATRTPRAAAPPPTAPERTSGSLMVDSRPAGARVFVDGKLVGNTPLLLDAVNVGEHAVRLELDGFAPWASTTKVAGGEKARVSGSLEQR